MKSIILLFAVLLASGSAQLSAQQSNQSEPRKTAEQRTEITVEKMTAELALTAEQQEQIREVVLNKEKKRDAGRYTEEDKKEYKKQIHAILTKEQQQKYHELKEEHKKEKEKQGKKKSGSGNNAQEQEVKD